MQRAVLDAAESGRPVVPWSLYPAVFGTDRPTKTHTVALNRAVRGLVASGHLVWRDAPCPDHRAHDEHQGERRVGACRTCNRSLNRRPRLTPCLVPPTIRPEGLRIEPIAARLAGRTVVAQHYLHRRPSISFAYGLFREQDLVGVVTFGTPASRHLTVGVCPTDPASVIELNRLWVSDAEGRNTESWFVSRALKMMPPRIVVSYADTVHGHTGYVYRALNFRSAGWTDMERKTPRFDYVANSGGHTRDSFRPGGEGWSERVRRRPKMRYWTVTGNRTDRRALTLVCAWPSMDWTTIPPPTEHISLKRATSPFQGRSRVLR